MKNANESWSSARVFFLRSFSTPSSATLLPLLSSLSFLSVILLPGLVRRGEGGREFTGRSKSFARKAKTLANGCFSWAEYLKKGAGGGKGNGWRP